MSSCLDCRRIVFLVLLTTSKRLILAFRRFNLFCIFVNIKLVWTALNRGKKFWGFHGRNGACEVCLVGLKCLQWSLVSWFWAIVEGARDEWNASVEIFYKRSQNQNPRYLAKKKIQLKQNQILRANAFMAWYVVEHKMFHLLFVPLIPSVYYES